VFAGTPVIRGAALDALLTAGHTIAAVYTQPDRPSGRGLGDCSGPVKRRAIEHGLAIEQPVSLRDEGAVEQLRRYAPEVMVVVAYGSSCRSMCSTPPALGCVNIHASVLPRWRGAAPIQRAIEIGDEETGVTIMKMDAGLDTGPILLARRTSIGPSRNERTLHVRLAQLGGIAIVDALAEWTAGRSRLGRSPSKASPALRDPQGRGCDRRSQPAAASTRKYARSTPWPVAVTSLNGEAWRVCPRRQSPMAAVPRAKSCSRQRRTRRCDGRGALRFLALQLPGRVSPPRPIS
jgi:methionyl-tRNA formyltransferase